MEKFDKIAVLDNEIEAQLLESILSEREVPHRFKSYYDEVYGGLFQVQKGWGFVSAPAVYKDLILEVLNDMRKYGWE